MSSENSVKLDILDIVSKAHILPRMGKVGRPRKAKTKVVYARIPKELERQLREESEREHRELSATIGFILEKYFERKEAEATA